MPSEAKFTDNKPLDYYYKHGYKLMNPFCRILSENPHYRFILEWRNLKYEGEKDSRHRIADSITIMILMALQKSLDSKSWDLLDLDDLMTKTVITGDAGTEHRSLVDGYRKEGVTDGLPTAAEVLAASRKMSRDKLGSLWRLVIETREALLSASPATCSWLIRGDTAGMLGYLSTQGVSFPADSSLGGAIRFDTRWRTNQFFSTSEGDELASLAGKALVWLICIEPSTTQGRAGGIYKSEAEVLFPYDVTLHLEGGIWVSSIAQIDSLKLSAFANSDDLRTKMRQVYEANKHAWANGKVKFLVAKET